jgi:hypothetical protein
MYGSDPSDKLVIHAFYQPSLGLTTPRAKVYVWQTPSFIANIYGAYARTNENK